MRNQPELSRRLGYLGRFAGTGVLAFCLAVAAHAQQEQQSQGQGQDQGQSQQAQSADQSQQSPPAQAQAPDQQPAKPKYPSQDADKPPYSNDRPHRTARDQDAAHNPIAPENPPPPATYAQSQPLPSALTIPKGTVLLVRTNNFLSSDHNQVGDQFTATLEQPIVVNGWVVARRGQTVVGQVKAAQKAGRVKGVSQLGLELTDVSLVDGAQAPILTELWKASAGTSHGQDAATVAGSTGLGAAIGAAADWGRGAALGAGIGAAAGIGAVLLTRGRPTELPPETPLSFQLVDPVTVDTSKGQQAFLPVTQEDYDHSSRRRPRLARPYPGPWYGPRCGPYGPCSPYPIYYRP